MNQNEKEIKKEYIKMLTNNNPNYDALLTYAFYVIINSNKEIDIEFAYSIILNYSLITYDYEPLYEFSMIMGFAPIIPEISNLVRKKTINEELLENLYIIDNKYNEKILTSGQIKLFNLIDINKNYSAVAPTSYGKTEIIINSSLDSDGDIVIIVPLIALLNQVRRDILNESNKRGLKVKVVTHHEMKASSTEKNIYVLTQERCLELIKKDNNFNPTQLFVDESHNLLKNNSRSYKLSEVIHLLKKRGTIIKRFSPALINANSVKLKNDDTDLIIVDSIKDIKIYNYYIFFDRKKYLFLNNMRFDKNMLIDDNYKDEYDYIIKNSLEKNIVYLNTPTDIELRSKEFSLRLDTIESNNINKVCNTLKDFVGEDYYIIELLKKGIIYVHGQMLPIIREYLIKEFNSLSEIKYLFTNSSILEGVNTKSDNLFILDYKISNSIMECNDFINLRGRINRLGEIFNKNLNKLICNIHILCLTRNKKDAFVSRILKPVVNKDYIDKKNNPYLLNVEKVDISNMIDEEKKSLEKSVTRLKLLDDNFNINSVVLNIINIEKYDNIKRQCYLNDVSIGNNFDEVTQKIVKYHSLKMDNVEDLLFCISDIFGFNSIDDYELKRLVNLNARKFYSMLLNWQGSGKSIKHQTSLMYEYYKKSNDDIIYIGAKNRGNICMISNKDELRIATEEEIKIYNLKKVYIDKSKISLPDLYNLCVIKILLENNFISFKIIPYVETLHNIDETIISDRLYKYIKYGTDNEKAIILLQEGMSLYLAKTLVSKDDYLKCIDFNDENIIIKKDILEIFNENDVLLLELKYFIE